MTLAMMTLTLDDLDLGWPWTTLIFTYLALGWPWPWMTFDIGWPWVWMTLTLDDLQSGSESESPPLGWAKCLFYIIFGNFRWFYRILYYFRQFYQMLGDFRRFYIIFMQLKKMLGDFLRFYIFGQFYVILYDCQMTDRWYCVFIHRPRSGHGG